MPNYVFSATNPATNLAKTVANTSYSLNEYLHRVSKLILKKLFGTLSNKKIAILGFAFKANTNDTRESQAIQICKDLIDEGAILNIHDPKVIENQIKIDLEGLFKDFHKDKEEISNLNQSWVQIPDLEDVFENCEAALIVSEWKEYSKIDWEEVVKK